MIAAGLPLWHLQALAEGRPSVVRWDPLPYSPIHYDDINAQLAALLDAATVPATIVNWAGDVPVTVQQWSAYFADLLGVDAELQRRRRCPVHRVGSVGDHTKRLSITGPCTVDWKVGFRDMAARYFPDRVRLSRYLSAEQLLDKAIAEGGHDDFGPGDFREGLDVLLDSLERDGDLHPDTDAAVMGDLCRRLVNRLEVERWYAEHPELSTMSPILGPVDINGLPRTGTTALADMLSLDPQFRSLRGWEQSKPVPPPVAGAGGSMIPAGRSSYGCTSSVRPSRRPCTSSKSTPPWRTPRSSAWHSMASR